MASSTILDVMPEEDLKVLAEGVRSGDPGAVALLEACFELELADASPDTRAATADMFLNKVNLMLSGTQQPANKIVRFSRVHSPEEQAAAMTAGNSDLTL